MKIFRLLVYEGAEEWVENTLVNNAIVDTFVTVYGSITEVFDLDKMIEIIQEELKEDSHD